MRGAGAGHRAGWDLTLTAPKTVSLLWAAGDAEARAQLEAIHAAAVEEALGFLCAEVRIPTKPAGDSDLKPAVIPRRSRPPARSEAGQ